MFKITLLAILSTLFISFIIALGFCLISVNTGIIIFCVVTGLQMFIGYPINRYLDGKEKTLMTYSKLLSEQELFIATSHTTNIECAFCNTMNNTKIHINNDYTFKCRDCGNVNKVVVERTSCRVTDLEVADEITDGE